MAQEDVHVTNGNQDYWILVNQSGGAGVYTYGSNTLEIYNSFGLGVRTTRIGQVDFDSSAIPTGSTITSIKVRWYDHIYNKSKGVTQQRIISIYNGSSGQYLQAYTNSTTLSSGFHDFTTTDSTILAGAENLHNSNQEIRIRFSTPDAGDKQYYDWTVRAYEYPPSPQFYPTVLVDYTEASGTRRRAIIIS